MRKVILAIPFLILSAGCSDEPNNETIQHTVTVYPKFQVTCPINTIQSVTDTVTNASTYNYYSTSLLFFNRSIGSPAVKQYPTSCVVKEIN